MSEAHRYTPVPADIIIRQLTTVEDMEWIASKLQQSKQYDGTYKYDPKRKAVIYTKYYSTYGDGVDEVQHVYLKPGAWVAWYDCVNFNEKAFEIFNSGTPETIAAKMKPYFRYVKAEHHHE
tara:strand:- start:89 stop:451 length:363 start_codon:yes stop_codon:yes gene_type:complete